MVNSSRKFNKHTIKPLKLVYITHVRFVFLTYRLKGIIIITRNNDDNDEDMITY